MVIAGVASELTVAITQEAVPKVLMTVEVRGPAAMRSILKHQISDRSRIE